LSRIDWTAIAIKFFAAYEIFRTLLVTASYSLILITAQTDPDSDFAVITNFLVPLLIGVILPLLLSVLLWRNANSIAGWMWKSQEAKQEAEASTAKFFGAKAAVLTGIGIFIFVTHFPEWLAAFSSLISFYGEPASSMTYQIRETHIPTEIVLLIARVVQLILATVFILVPKRVLVFLDKIQDTWDLTTEV
jgi:hypothetical protein